MARLAILAFAAVMRETTSMALSRRQTLQRGSLAAVVPLLAPAPALASTKTDAEKVLEALQPLSGYVDEGKWDAVRTVLAQSPVVELWKTGNSKNWIRAAALSAGDPELIELSEDLSSALQLTDQCEAASVKNAAATPSPRHAAFDTGTYTTTTLSTFSRAMGRRAAASMASRSTPSTRDSSVPTQVKTKEPKDQIAVAKNKLKAIIASL